MTAQQPEETITPEEQDALTQLDAEINDAPAVYEWYYRRTPPIRWFMSLIEFIICYGLALFLYINGHSLYGIVPLVIVGTVMPLVGYYLFQPEQDFNYQLTPLGLRVRYKDRITDAAYTFMRGSAWVGVAVCVIAALTLGPMAFVGAGGFALMGFTMTNFRNVEKSDNQIFNFEHSYFFEDYYQKHRTYTLCPTLKQDLQHPYAVRFNHSDDSQRGEILEQLRRYINIDERPIMEVLDELREEVS